MSAGELFISVDVETAGPIPGRYSLLSIGACVAADPTQTFYATLRPTSMEAVPEALAVTGFTLVQLQQEGEEPETAMIRFVSWIRAVAEARTPVFVGLNAAFDWSFVNHYLLSFAGQNPFGIAPVDIKSLYFGQHGGTWRDTRSSQIVKTLGIENGATHNALDDARFQAELFTRLRRPSSVKR